MDPGSPLNVAQGLAAMCASGLERLDAQMLVLHALGRSPFDRAWLVAHDTDLLSASQLEALQSLIQRRLAGVPVAYLIGHKEFFGLDLLVNEHTLIPRPDTETLVQWALDICSERPGLQLLDMGCGSGAIALAVKSAKTDLQVHACDISGGALEVASANARRLGLQIAFAQSNWFENVQGQFDVIVSNPPYIAEHDPHLEDLRFEPNTALTSGTDGLDDIRRIIHGAKNHLASDGWLLLEHGYDQAAVVRELLSQAGFTLAQSRCDLAGTERCSGGQFNHPAYGNPKMK